MNMRRKIIKMALPAIVENIFQITLSTVDTYFVATIGTVAISAVGVNVLITNLYLTFFIALGAGASIMVARAFGKKDVEKLKHHIRDGLLLTFMVSVFFLMINVTFGSRMIQLLAREEALIESSRVYFTAVIIPIGAMSFMVVLSSLLKAIGDTKTPMMTVLVINVINVVLDYVLIVGVGSFKGVGILGAGIGTTTARVIGCVILFIRLEQKTGFIQKATLRLTKDTKELVRYAVPIGLEKVSMRIGQLVYGSLIIGIGIKHYAAHNIAGTIEAYSYLPALGFGVAAFTLIGHAIGKEEFALIQLIGIKTYQYATLLMIGIGVVFFVFAPQLAGLFTDDQDIIQLVVFVLRMIALFQPLLASTQVISSSLQALGDVKYPFVLTTIGIWCIRILGTYVLGQRMGLGLIGVWISYCVDITFRGILLWIRFYQHTLLADALRKEFS